MGLYSFVYNSPLLVGSSLGAISQQGRHPRLSHEVAMSASFTQSQLEAIAGALGDTESGLAGSESRSSRAAISDQRQPQTGTTHFHMAEIKMYLMISDVALRVSLSQQPYELCA